MYVLNNCGRRYVSDKYVANAQHVRSYRVVWISFFSKINASIVSTVKDEPRYKSLTFSQYSMIPNKLEIAERINPYVQFGGNNDNLALTC